ncbi:MAG: hypothetical protein ACXU8N_05580 [Telluria sp.]
MGKKVFVGIGIVLGLALVATVVIFHTPYGQDTFQMIRKLHGK